MAIRGQPKVSLFPFMSILACTIGALTLLLVAMSLSAVGSTELAAQAYDEVRTAVQSDKAALAEDLDRLSDAEEVWAELDQILVEHGLAAGLSISSIEREWQRSELRAELRSELSAIGTELQQISQKRDAVEVTIEVLQSRRETLPILIDPTGLSQHWRSFFVECDGGGATAYRASDDFRYFVAKDAISSSGDFGRYLRRVRAVPGALLVLLVRPDGIATSVRTEQVARSAGVRVARLPLPGKGPIDWRLLRLAEGEAS
ncbi:MAG: hypothetical protein VCB25_09070 [Myxococcota bacterium]